jgi:hypothetical protein
MIKEIILLALIYEVGTILVRIKFGSMKNFYKKNKEKLKIRIHHGYTGLILILIYLFYPFEILAIIGGFLLVSDIVHHFVVLPIWIGKTEFP